LFLSSLTPTRNVLHDVGWDLPAELLVGSCSACFEAAVEVEDGVGVDMTFFRVLSSLFDECVSVFFMKFVTEFDEIRRESRSLVEVAG